MKGFSCSDQSALAWKRVEWCQHPKPIQAVTGAACGHCVLKAYALPEYHGGIGGNVQKGSLKGECWLLAV